MSNRKVIRPSYEVLRAYNDVLRGQRLDVEVGGPTFASPAVGAVPATSGLPSVSALATAQSDRRRLIVINKSTHEAADVTIDTGPGGLVQTGVARELWDSRIFAPSHASGAIRWRGIGAATTGSTVRVLMAPHSLLWLELQVR